MTTFAQPDAGWTRPPAKGLAGRISTHVVDTVSAAARNKPRSLQPNAGPSELGIPCDRRIAYKIASWDQPNSHRDQWLSMIGTAVHAEMAAIFENENRRLGRERYLIERRVHLPHGISGSCDLYDRETCTGNDWKLVGLDRIKKYRVSGPGDQYRVQGHLYGLGLMLAGETPADIAITFLPRGGRLTDLHVWTEPFDYQVALDALARHEAIKQAVITVDPELYPERWAAFRTAESFCTYCPYHLPLSTDLSRGCPGHKTPRPGLTGAPR